MAAARSVVEDDRPLARCTYAEHRQLMRAVRFYSWKIRVRVNKMGAERVREGASFKHRVKGLCPRFLAKHLRAKAYATRARYERLVREQARERRSYFRSLYEKWRCIHEHEGAWNDPGYPHWGGLQMDMGFQQTYGPEFLRRWGTADNWPVWAQLTAAERAYHGYAGYGGRGFTPWPNTARICGLL